MKDSIMQGASKTGLVKIDERRKCIVIDRREYWLTPKEYILFKLLAEDPGKVFSVDEIIQCVWPGRRDLTASNVEQQVYLLRKKIEPDLHNPCLIINSRGFGYYLTTDRVS